MKIRLAAPLQRNSIVDGEGIRAVVWTQGCIHNCFGCHNPNTHDVNGGFEVDIEELKKDIKSLNEEDGVTFSGGDPFCQVDACLELARYCHDICLNVWCYTGYTYEKLIELAKEKTNILDFLNEIDVLIDGPFILAKKSFDVKFRGSKNQRVIDVKKSLKKGSVVEVKKYQYIENKNPENEKKEEIYI
jgi:anaerobic ribonucleoside-triphosphate reductase activating protein